MLVGKKIIVRTVREADQQQWFDLSADIRHMGEFWPLNLMSEIKSKKRLAETGWLDDNYGMLAITTLENEIVGQIVFFKTAEYQNAFELGYRIFQPQHWGKGYMSEAVSLVVAFLFDTKPVDRIQATTLPGNQGSQRVLEGCNFQFEGVLRKAIFHQGQSQDLRLYSIIRGEHQPLSKVLA